MSCYCDSHLSESSLINDLTSGRIDSLLIYSVDAYLVIAVAFD